MTRLSVDISDELHQFLKIHTAYKKETIMSYVRDAIYNRIKQEKLLNEESLEALEESKKGLNINRYSSYKDMYKKLNLI